jgi:hypothetical protein
MNHCYNITDLSPLEGIHTLYMIHCTGVTDLTPLKGIHTLHIHECNQITNEKLEVLKGSEIYR